MDAHKIWDALSHIPETPVTATWNIVNLLPEPDNHISEITTTRTVAEELIEHVSDMLGEIKSDIEPESHHYSPEDISHISDIINEIMQSVIELQRTMGQTREEE